MKKWTRVRFENRDGVIVGESGFINVIRNKLMLVRFDDNPDGIEFKDITKLEVLK